MTLKGNLEDFNLTNIFQIISMEKKTGVLKVIQDNHIARITFSKGNIFCAEQETEKEEYKIKNILLGNKILDIFTWELVYREHIKTLLPYWQLLKKHIKIETLQRLIYKQTKDTLFILLRWKKGFYQFENIPSLNIDISIFTPYNTEFLLMEIIRYIDEWKEISSKFPPIDMRITKPTISNTCEITEDEKYLLGLVSKKTSVNDLLTSSLLDEFTTRNTILELIRKGLLLRYKTIKLEKGKSNISFSNILYNLKVITISIILLSGGIYITWLTIKDYSLIVNKLIYLFN